jgi:hypothetical protein
MVSGPYFYLLLVYHPSATACQGAMQAEGVGGGKPILLKRVLRKAKRQQEGYSSFCQGDREGWWLLLPPTYVREVGEGGLGLLRYQWPAVSRMGRQGARGRKNRQPPCSYRMNRITRIHACFPFPYVRMRRSQGHIGEKSGELPLSMRLGRTPTRRLLPQLEDHQPGYGGGEPSSLKKPPFEL